MFIIIVLCKLVLSDSYDCRFANMIILFIHSQCLPKSR